MIMNNRLTSPRPSRPGGCQYRRLDCESFTPPRKKQTIKKDNLFFYRAVGVLHHANDVNGDS